MKKVISLMLLALAGGVYAQEIAILDRGLNTTMNNRGLFYNPMCIDNTVDHRQATLTGFHQQGDGAETVSIGIARYITLYTINLCHSAYSNMSSAATRANVPRTRTYGSNNSGTPYQVAMWGQSASRYDFPTPFNTQRFGANLRHGSDVATAAYDFDSSVRRKMVQLARIQSVPRDIENCSTNLSAINPNTTSFGGTKRVTQALRDIIEDPDGVDAINLSFQFRSSYCQRQQNVLVPESCQGPRLNRPGQREIDQLNRMGIAVVTGLHNIDIGANEETWPACLDGVIKVGAENDNRGLHYNGIPGGIGVGANGIDFYAKNTNRDGEAGNSMAAPKIATAYALLKTAVPNSTVDQRTEALNNASTLTKTHRINGIDYKRRYVKKNHIDEAIELLEKMVRGNIDNISFEDTNQYGPIYDDDSSNYTFEIDFNELIGSNSASTSAADSALLANTAASASTTVSNVRDVVISFDTKMSWNHFYQNSIKLYINNVLRASTPFHVNEGSFSYIFNRNIFLPGENIVRLEPGSDSSQRPWGISNIKADFHPVIPLTVGQADSSEYGYSHTPPRYTGLRASFMVDNLDSDFTLSVTGWDIDTVDENQVFINGVSLGHLSKGAASSQYSPRDTFVLRKEDLLVGQNVIEFMQRYPGGDWTGFEFEKWAVKDILVESAPSDLTVPVFSIIDRSLKSNIPFAVSASVRNGGLGYSDATTLQFYVSSDETISTADTLINTQSFAQLAPNRTRILNTNIQSSLVNQGYYLGACIVAVTGEHNTGNNCSASVPLKNNVNIAPIIMLLLLDDG